MDRERLKRLITEEILRVLAEFGAEAANKAHTQASAPYAVPPRWRHERPQAPQVHAAPDRHLGLGLVLFSGSSAPSEALLEALGALAGHGAELLAVPSLTYRLTRLYGADPLRGMPAFSVPDDEPALLKAIDKAQFILAPALSANTLAKLSVGIEDSTPTRTLAAALALGKPLILVEETVNPTGGVKADPRWDRLRALGARGAALTEPARLVGDVFEKLWPAGERPYEAPAPKTAPRRPIVTTEDVYDAFKMGAGELVIPADAIVTPEALDDAARRGMSIRRLEL